jgi:carbamoyltransferase
MLYVVPVRPAKQAILPAITHVDGTGRPQTVFRDANPRYYRLIERICSSHRRSGDTQHLFQS